MVSRVIILLLVHALATVAANNDMYCKVPDEQLYVYRVPTHNCKCSKEDEGLLRYHNKKLQICDGATFVDVSGGPAPTLAPTLPPTPPPTPPTTPKPTTLPPPVGDEKNPGTSCSEIGSKRRLAKLSLTVYH